MFKKLIFRTKGELQLEKHKDYRNVVLIQIVIITFTLTLSEFLLEDPSTSEAKFVATLFASFGVLYSFLQWDLLRDFTSNRILINLYLFILIGIVITGLLVQFPYYQILEVPDRQIYLFVIHSVFFPIEVTVIGFAIRDIFSGEFLTPDKLWGSACVFLMIGISFGSLYHLICIIKPGSLSNTIELANYSDCLNYSLSILGGIDPGQPTASRLIRNISVIEAVWGNLFVVLIIGTLMGLPRLPKPESKEIIH